MQDSNLFRSRVAACLLVAMGAAFLSSSMEPAAFAARQDQDKPAHMIQRKSDSISRLAKLVQPVNALAAEGQAGSPAAPFIFDGPVESHLNAVQCLAAAAWYEAGDDPAGQRSVIQVVLNRVRHKAFPNTVCGVVMQGSERSTGCQFTFTCDGSLYRRKPSAGAWDRAQTRAEAAINGAVDSTVLDATHYHANYVSPYWARQMVPLTTIGAHLFYRWAGSKGQLPSRKPALGIEDSSDLVAAMDAKAPHPGSGMGVTASGSSTNDRGAVAAPFIQAERVTGMDIPRASTVIFAEFDPASMTGRWALSALQSCGDKRDCKVLGYGSVEEVARNRFRPTSQRERPLFMFVRDSTSGMELALWDCDRAARPKQSECLPASAAALRTFVADRAI